MEMFHCLLTCSISEKDLCCFCLCALFVRENVIEFQRNQMEEMEAASALLREELRNNEAEYEEKLLQVRQQQTSKLR